MFLINSRLGRFSAACFSSPRSVVHLPQAPLIPKLRGHFAEFLFRGSLEHLRLLASPTCVRLRYGRMMNCPARLFLAVGSTALGGAKLAPSASALGYPDGFAYLETPTTLHRDIHHPTAISLPRPPSGS